MEILLNAYSILGTAWSTRVALQYHGMGLFYIRATHLEGVEVPYDAWESNLIYTGRKARYLMVPEDLVSYLGLLLQLNHGAMF